MVNVSEDVVNLIGKESEKEETKGSERKNKILSTFCTFTLISVVWKRKGKYCTAA